MHTRDVDAKMCAPILDGIPLEGTLYPLKARYEFSMRLGEREPLFLGIDFGNPREPNEVVEGEIEQGAVEVEKHGIDLPPGGRLMGGK